MKQKKAAVVFSTVIWMSILSACSSVKYTYHSIYEIDGCQITRQKLNNQLMRNGFMRNSTSASMYDVFKKTNIIKKSILASDPYEDRSGEVAVAACQKYVVAEEWKSCQQEKDCTKSNQTQIKEVLEKMGCKVTSKSARAKSWQLEDRQDWNQDTCSEIIKNLAI